MNNIYRLCNKEYSKAENKKINKYAKIFYNLSTSSLHHVNNLHIKQEKIETLSIDKSSFISESIITYIKNTKKYIYKFTGVVNNKNVTLYFVSFNINTKLQNYSTLAFMVIYMLTTIKNNCSKNLEIKIYLTPLKKKLPPNKTDILGPNEVNTGFSTIGCRNHATITLYREEEWLKVLIHELFHNLNLDFADMNITDTKDKLYQLFGLKSNYEITETYTEIWARIINVVVSCTIKTNSYDNFLKLFTKSIEEERLFTLKQATVILDRITHIKEYKEDSNIFCYYILTAALFNNFLHFLDWCQENNTGLFKFKSTQKTLDSFINLILKECNSNDFKSNISCIRNANTGNSNSLRMTTIMPILY